MYLSISSSQLRLLRTACHFHLSSSSEEYLLCLPWQLNELQLAFFYHCNSRNSSLSFSPKQLRGVLAIFTLATQWITTCYFCISNSDECTSGYFHLHNSHECPSAIFTSANQMNTHLAIFTFITRMNAHLQFSPQQLRWMHIWQFSPYRECVTRFSTSSFSHDSNPSGPLINRLKYFPVSISLRYLNF